VKWEVLDHDTLKRLRSDPAFFMSYLFKVNLFPYQKAICDVVASGEQTVAVLKSRQIGVSFTAAALCLWYASTHRNSVVLILSLYRRQAQQVYRYILQFLYGVPEILDELIILPYGVTRSELRFRNGSIIKYLNCSRPEAVNVRGQVADLLIVDEAILILDKMWSAIEPITTMRQGQRVYISTAGVEGCFFHSVCEKIKHLGERISLGGPAFKYVSSKGVLFYLPACTYEAKAKSVEERFRDVLCPVRKPEDLQRSLEELKSLNFRREYLCEWVGCEDQMFPLIHKVHRVSDVEVVNRWYAGLDVGEVRNPTVLTILKGDIENALVYRTYEWRRMIDRRDLARQIARKLKRKNRFYINAPLVMDNQGIGVGLYERLLDEGVPLHGVAWNLTTKNKVMFELKDALTSGRLKIPEDEGQLIYELRSYFAEQIAGTTKYEFHTIDTDDYVDSLALAWSAVPKISVIPSIRMEVR